MVSHFGPVLLKGQAGDGGKCPVAVACTCRSGFRWNGGLKPVCGESKCEREGEMETTGKMPLRGILCVMERYVGPGRWL